MTSVQIIPGDFTITDPAWPRLHLWRRGHVFTSDDFTVDGDPVGRMTTAALGGQPVMWQGNAGAWTVEDGVLRSPSGTGSMFLNLPADDFTLSIKIQALPISQQVLLIGRRSDIAYNPNISQIRLQTYNNGRVFLQEQLGGELVGLGESLSRVEAGDTISLHLKGGIAELWINGEPEVSEVTRVVGGGGYAGLSVTGAGAAAEVGNFLVNAG